MNTNETRQKILIVDDSAMNRDMLIDMLEDDFEILEACDGAEAIQMIHDYGTNLDLMLLDIVMPEINGFEVLAVMKASNILEDVPVIMISSENQPSDIERAYEMGVTDYINRPFNVSIVRRRVMNTLHLHAKQKKLNQIIMNLIYEKEKNNNMLINILSHIVEFRNGESGLHVLHISSITDILLQHLVQKTDRYHLTQADISLITIGSALHDIGKISIPGSILNKPGRLTNEEFDRMKTHTVMGESMLKEIPMYQNEPLVKVAREICRWHHERYDGRGYPDGLKGEEIPISAQIVSVADVYDALTSERCYKKAFSHEKALQMILNGECGKFSDLLLECLQETHEAIIEELSVQSTMGVHEKKLQDLVDEFTQFYEFEGLIRPVKEMIKEQRKLKFYSSTAEELQFDYDARTGVMVLSAWGAELLGLDATIYNTKEKYAGFVSESCNEQLRTLFLRTDSTNPDVRTVIEIKIQGQLYTGELIARVLWSEDDKPEYLGAVGKVVHLKKIS
ncbi:MAG: response regulator [Oscillospiraceae bacterium]|nr:response regulator [Oscillospiraceae bacterium]